MWKTARSLEQIRDNITKRLTGNEEGLAALWNFDDPAQPGRDATPNRHHGQIKGGAVVAAAEASPLAAMASPFASPNNRVLELDGKESYVELPPDILRGLEEATVESWVRCDEFLAWSRFFTFGEGENRLAVVNSEIGGDLWTALDLGRNAAGEFINHGFDSISALKPGRWTHLALVVGKDGTRLHVDGVLAGRSPETVLSLLKGHSENRLGAGGGVSALHGELDEVRVWKVSRTVEQIRENLLKRLTGSEPGLIGLWNFDDSANPGRDGSPNHHDGKLMGNARAVAADQTAEHRAAETAALQPPGENVLALIEKGSFVELPSDVFNDFTEATVEAWVKWHGFHDRYQRIFNYGGLVRDYALQTRTGTNRLWWVGLEPAAGLKVAEAANILRAGQWAHVAGVSGPDGMKLYVNGMLAAKNPHTGCFKNLGPGNKSRLGQSVVEVLNGKPFDATPFDGELSEVRVWKVARSEEQIRENLAKNLTGSEVGLEALWSFNDPGNPGRDASANHYDGKLMGNARLVPVRSSSATATGRASVATSTVSGRITDAAGKPVRGAEVRVMQGERALGTVKSGDGGEYFLLFAHRPAPYRVLASLEALEAASAETEFFEGANQLNLTLRDTLRISGTLAGADDQPRRGVKVEAVSSDGAVAGFSVSDGKGRFNLQGLPGGEFKLRAAGAEMEDGKTFTVRAEEPLSDLKLTIPAVAALKRPPTENRVLALDGSGAHLNLPTGMFGNLRETTVEAWVRFGTLVGHQRFFSYGSMGSNLYLGRGGVSDLEYGAFHPQNRERFGHGFRAAGVLEAGRWCHVAAVIDARETRLYFNGTLAGAAQRASSFTELLANSPAYIGRWSDAGSGFTGDIDEVRVWAAARTGDEIRATMFQRLSGREEGLAALWNFDDPDKPGRDATPNGFDGEMVQNAAAQPETLPKAAAEITQWASFSGVAIDVDGRPLNKVKVRAERGEEHFDAETDVIGNFSLLVRGSTEPWRVTATRGDLSATPTNLVLDAGDHRLTLTLRDAAPLSGNLRAPDGSPLPTVVVQALPVVEKSGTLVIPGLAAEIFNIQPVTDFPVIPDSTAPTVQRIDQRVDFPLVNGSISGADAKVAMAFFARWKGRIRIGKGGDYAFHLAANDAARLLIDGVKVVESIWPKGTGGLSQTAPLVANEKTGAVTLEAGDHELMLEFYNNQGRDGVRLAWSIGGGEKAVVPPEVLFHERAKPVTLTVMSDARGRFRFPSAAPGRYTLRAHVPGGFAAWENEREVIVEPDKQLANLDFTLAPFKQGRWKSYTHENGLAADVAQCVFQAADGAMWFGTNQGVSRFDGRTFSSLPAEDGPPRDAIHAIQEDAAGRIWMAGLPRLHRYDPKAKSPRVRAFTTADGLPSETVTTLARDKVDRLWVGTTQGLCYYDPAAEKSGGKPFVSTIREKSQLVKELAPGGRHGALAGAARLVETRRPAAFPPTQPMTTEKVLQLDGKDGYVELPAGIFNDLDTATIEGWVKWDSFQPNSRMLDFAIGNRLVNVRNDGSNPGLVVETFGSGKRKMVRVPGMITPGKWLHLAVVTGLDQTKLYVNGILLKNGVVEEPDTFRSAEFSRKNFLGRSNAKVIYALDGDFQGEMDEVRVWSGERSEDQIADGFAKKLTGNEPGLLGLWNFEDGTARDLTPNGHDGGVAGPAQIAETQRPAPDAALLVKESVLQLDGATGYAETPALALNGNTMTVTAWVKSDAAQRNTAHILSARAAAENVGKDTFGLFVSSAGGDLRYNWLDSNLSYNWNSGLTPPVGRWFFVALVVTPDDATLYLDGGDGLKSATHAMEHGVMPMAGSLIIGFDKATATGARYWNGAIDDVRIWKKALSPEEIQAGMNTAPAVGAPGLLAWWNFDETIAGERDVPLFAEPVSSLRAGSDGDLWIGTAKGATRLPSGEAGSQAAQNFTSADGLGTGPVIALFEAADGAMWFGSGAGGVSRLNRRTKGREASSNDDPSPAFTTFTTADGLNNNTVRRIAQDAEGTMWFAGGSQVGAGNGGLSRYDGKSFVNFRRADGLASDMSLIFSSMDRVAFGLRRFLASRTTITGRLRSLEKRRAWIPESLRASSQPRTATCGSRLVKIARAKRNFRDLMARG